MDIEEFCTRFGDKPRSIEEVLRRWQFDELDGLLRTLGNHYDQLIGSAVIVGDAMHGGTLLDQIPPEVKQAFTNLMHAKADTYQEMRQILLDHCQLADGSYLSFEDARVLGFVSKLKGQIGENLFQQHVGKAAMLADSGSQEAWDVAVKQADGMHHYVQVKLYSDPHKVVRQMIKVQERLLDGDLLGVNHETVGQVYFAVPEDIKDEVQRLANAHEGLSEMLYDKHIPINAKDAADLVTEGMSNVGPDKLSHFFHEMLGGAVAAGSLHAIVHGFLWYKGSKEFSIAFADATANTAISTTGLGIGLLAEAFCHTATLSSAVGIGSRLLLGRVARSRWSFADFLEESIKRGGIQARAVSEFMPHVVG